MNKSKTRLVFINQIRQKIGVMYGDPNTTTGGLPPKFYASVRMEVKRITHVKDGEDQPAWKPAFAWSRTRLPRHSATPSSTSSTPAASTTRATC
ncbi:MAG: hypothetical protein U0792_20350 [Gemmataceae bacterium]